MVLAKVQLRPYTTVKLMLKSFKIQAFADLRHHQGRNEMMVFSFTLIGTLCQPACCYLCSTGGLKDYFLQMIDTTTSMCCTVI